MIVPMNVTTYWFYAWWFSNMSEGACLLWITENSELSSFWMCCFSQTRMWMWKHCCLLTRFPVVPRPVLVWELLPGAERHDHGKPVSVRDDAELNRRTASLLEAKLPETLPPMIPHQSYQEYGQHFSRNLSGKSVLETIQSVFQTTAESFGK